MMVPFENVSRAKFTSGGRAMFEGRSFWRISGIFERDHLLGLNGAFRVEAVEVGRPDRPAGEGFSHAGHTDRRLSFPP